MNISKRPSADIAGREWQSDNIGTASTLRVSIHAPYARPSPSKIVH
jgi:hypothetical protein